MNKAIAFFGPTASGKTNISIELAKVFSGQIVNMDSVQIYKKFNIGSAKPTHSDRQQAVFHLVDSVEPDRVINAFDIYESSINISKKIKKDGEIPIFSGGTGLYFKAIFNGMFEGPSRNDEIRERIREEVNSTSLRDVYNKLLKIDKEAALKISENDFRRIERALEYYYITGEKISDARKNQDYEPPFDFIKIAISYPREELYNRIENRIDIMLKEGLVYEVHEILNHYGDIDILKSAIGYKEVRSYILNEIDEKEMIRLLKRNTRRFAKRQLTLFRAIPGVKWFVPPNTKDIIDYIKSSL